MPQNSIFLGDAAQALGFPFLNPYSESGGSDYTHGANFASQGATVKPPDSSNKDWVSQYYLAIQLNRMKTFASKVSKGDKFKQLIIQLFFFFLRLIHHFFVNQNLRLFQSSFTRCIRKINLHHSYRPKWCYRGLGISWRRWGKTESSPSGEWYC